MKLFDKIDSFADKKLTLNRTKSRDAFWFRLSKYADHSIPGHWDPVYGLLCNFGPITS